MAAITRKVFPCSFRSFMRAQVRWASEKEESSGGGGGKKGLILGAYLDPSSKKHKLTSSAAKFNAQVGGRLEELLTEGRPLTQGRNTVFQNLDPEYYSVSVVGLGREDAGYDPLETLDECKENVRVAAAMGARWLRHQGVSSLHVDGMGSPEAAAEGASLGLWRYDDFKAPEKRAPLPPLSLYQDDDKDAWQRGLYKAEAQNTARHLCDTPANLMTPSLFATSVMELLCPCGVSVDVHDRAWAESRRMHLFAHVARGSCEPPVVLELNYCGSGEEEHPILLVGSGLTFDTGGLCLKPCGGMGVQRGSIAGAAAVVAVMRAAAMLSMPVNLVGLVPVCENMPSGMAMRPGDIVMALNNKSVLIEHTDNEGRMLIADAIMLGVKNFSPRLVIDIGTLTEGAGVALGGAATAAFTESDALWKELQRAGSATGDRVWRLPLWSYFSKKVTKLLSADVTNRGMGPGGEGPCCAAAFIREFVPTSNCWLHLDIGSTGLVAVTEEVPYLHGQRMTGRPVRLLIQFLYQLACPSGCP